MNHGNNMKIITPISMWSNGVSEQAKILSLQCTNDNLFNSANFSYTLFSLEESSGLIGKSLSNGNLTMTGSAYENWVTNDEAYVWAAEALNLTITGNYQYPTPVQPQP